MPRLQLVQGWGYRQGRALCWPLCSSPCTASADVIEATSPSLVPIKTHRHTLFVWSNRNPSTADVIEATPPRLFQSKFIWHLLLKVIETAPPRMVPSKPIYR
ncbi:hypothetical protein NQD34_017600 [Periophthalmus magnuspinnatus]|nr:hypothetical protein NQD34_017600 [Periophthalmus magnuspinnatus]